MEILKQRPTVLIRIITHYLESHRRLVVPQLGAFVVKEPEGVVLFSELLKRDDGVLRGLLRASGQSELEAAGEIDRFVFEVRHAVQEGGEYALAGLGRLKPGPNGTIAFAYDPTTAVPDAATEDAGGAAEEREETEGAEEREGAAICGGAAEGSAEGSAEDAATLSATSAMPAAAGCVGSSHGVNPGNSERPADSATSANSLHPANPAEPNDSTAGSAGSPHARRLSDAYALYDTASAATPSHTTPSGGAAPHRAGGRGVPPRMQADQLARSVERAYSETFVSESATKNPDPSVRGLRYGKAPKKPKTDDAYTYMTRQRRRGDLFLWIAILAALIASAAIGFGYWHEHRERQAEAEYLEYRQLIDGTAPSRPASRTSDSDAAPAVPNPTTSDGEAAPTDAADAAAEGEE